MEKHKRYLDVKTVTRLSNIRLVAKLVVEGFISGLHKSPYKGYNVEFSEHRPYMQGDEPRDIDWKVYAKSDKFYVKQFEEDTNMRCVLMLDVSGSMEFGDGALNKRDFGSYLTASLSYLMLRQQDSVGLVTFAGGIRKFIPPRSNPNHFNVILDELEHTDPGGDTSVSSSLHELAERMKRRGLIVVISDLLDDPGKVVNGLKHLRHKKHEVIVFHVLHDHELDFPYKGQILFRDMEGGAEILTGATELAAEYRRLMGEFSDRYRRECLGNYMDYTLMRTGGGYDSALFTYLAKRRSV